MAQPERRTGYAHQRETTGTNRDYLPLRPFSKLELLLKERICSQREFFPLRVVPLGTLGECVPL